MASNCGYSIYNTAAMGGNQQHTCPIDLLFRVSVRKEGEIMDEPKLVTNRELLLQVLENQVALMEHQKQIPYYIRGKLIAETEALLERRE